MQLFAKIIDIPIHLARETVKCCRRLLIFDVFYRRISH